MCRAYIKPEMVPLKVPIESGIMDCSVRVDPTVVVEEFHDAGFSSGEEEWTIGFDEPIGD